MGLRSDSYYQAAQERIKEARFLHEKGFHSLSMYVSGLAVECLLRAFRLLKDPTFDERHDLWQLWKNTELANIHSKFYHKKIHISMGVVMSLWRNDYRFRSEAALRAYLKKIGVDRGVKGDFLKFNSKKLYDAAETIIYIGANLWKRSKEK
jgi:HEPN domain-containing protein